MVGFADRWRAWVERDRARGWGSWGVKLLAALLSPLMLAAAAGIWVWNRWPARPPAGPPAAREPAIVRRFMCSGDAHADCEKLTDDLVLFGMGRTWLPMCPRCRRREGIDESLVRRWPVPQAQRPS